MNLTVYIRMRQQTAEEWRERLLALSDAQRERLSAAMETHGVDAALAQWPDLIEVSMHPFPDAPGDVPASAGGRGGVVSEPIIAIVGESVPQIIMTPRGCLS